MGERRDLSVRLSNPPSFLLSLSFLRSPRPSRQDDGLWKRKERREKSKSEPLFYFASSSAGKRRKIDLDPPVYKLSETSAPFSSSSSFPSPLLPFPLRS